eukprot:1195210-Prorocentrum_minimum.AAC.3
MSRPRTHRGNALVSTLTNFSIGFTCVFSSIVSPGPSLNCVCCWPRTRRASREVGPPLSSSSEAYI